MLKSVLIAGVALAVLGGTPVLAQSTTTTTNRTGGAGIMMMTVDGLKDQKVYGADGKEIGEIDKVVRQSGGSKATVGGNLFAVVQAGGNWFGLGSEQVLVPINEFSKQGDRLTLPMNEQQATALQKYGEDDNQFAEVGDDQTLTEAQGSQ
jgi:hypothetical protein